jgi:hypothetical protein
MRKAFGKQEGFSTGGDSLASERILKNAICLNKRSMKIMLLFSVMKGIPED